MALPRIQQLAQSGSNAVAGAGSASTGSTIVVGVIQSSGSISATGSIVSLGGFTGSLQGIAATASYVSPTFLSASLAASGFGSATPTYTGSFATTGSTTFVGDVTVTGNLTAQQYIVSSSVFYVTTSYSSGSTIFGDTLDDNHNVTGSMGVTGSLSVNGSNVVLANQTASMSVATAASSSITYVSSSNFGLSEIEVADYDSNVAVTYTNGRLKFIFGTPTAPSAPALSFNRTFATDRFNQVSDAYTVTGTISVGGYTLISASLYEGATLLTSTGSLATQLQYSTTTSGSHTYTLIVTASSPLDGSLNKQSTSLAGTLSKANPGSPTITPTATVQLGATSNQIEQGATGSISFVSASGAANSWVNVNITSNVASPIYVTGSATGSSSISATATAYYSSSGVNGSDNSPALTTTATNSFTYTKIRSLRYGATATASYTSTQLENLAAWDSTLGGEVGTISKGTTTASGQSVTITWTGDRYHYIVFNSSLSSLSNITTAGFGVLSSFTLSTVGSYKVYRSNTLQAGGAGQSVTYVLT